MSTIEDFKTRFKDGLRPNNYQVFILPKLKFYDSDLETVSILCHSAQFPFHTFNTATTKINNKKLSVVNDIDYDPLTLTFYVDDKNEVLSFLYQWKNQIRSSDGKIGYFDEYIAEIVIEVFDRKKRQTAIVSLEEAYPVNIDTMELSYESKDTLMSVTVSFRFSELNYEFIRNADASRNAIENSKTWRDYLTVGNVRRVLNTRHKIEAIKRTIENPTPQEIAGIASKVFRKIDVPALSLPVVKKSPFSEGSDGTSELGQGSASKRPIAPSVRDRASKLFKNQPIAGSGGGYDIVGAASKRFKVEEV